MAAEDVLTMLAIGQTLIAVSLMATQFKTRIAFIPLAAFLTANSVADVMALLSQPWEKFQFELELVGVMSLYLIGPAFWIYTRSITGRDTESLFQPGDRKHIIPIVLAALVFLSTLFIPYDIRYSMLESDDFSPALDLTITLSLGAIIIATIVALLSIVHCGYYLVKALRRLSQYRRTLRNEFASIEDRDMIWLNVIVGVIVIYWFFFLGTTIFVVSDGDSDFLDIIDSTINIVMVWGISVWGLRQKPGLALHSTDSNKKIVETDSNAKYEKSGLTSDHADRIAAKIVQAMNNDRLFGDPNLSLQDLSQHISTPANYVSQTLNATIGESFFEFVNRHRVELALDLLKTTDNTILNIAIEVGFNSRSAFYKAFQKTTGKTPSAYRNAMKAEKNPQFVTS